MNVVINPLLTIQKAQGSLLKYSPCLLLRRHIGIGLTFPFDINIPKDVLTLMNPVP